MQSFFLSPKEPGSFGVIWGAGPVLLLPAATEDSLGSGKFGLGPTAVLLKQDVVSSTFLQPFLTYTTATKTTFGVNTESTYDWEAEQWTVPINLTLSQLLRIGSQVISLTLGGRYYAERPTPLRRDVPVSKEVATRRPRHAPRGTRPATARTLRGAASQIAMADTTLAPIESQNAST